MKPFASRKNKSEYVRHTRQGTEVKCRLSISRGNDQIEWTHGSLAVVLNPFRKTVMATPRCALRAVLF